MNNKLIILSIIIITLTVLLIYPKIEFYKDGYLYMMGYSSPFDKSEDFEELEQEMCYDESYSYNKKRNISINGWDYKGFLFFKWFKIKYVEGNVCETEFVLEESYIEHFLKNAIIDEESDIVDLANLIKNKEAIIANKRYPWNDNYKWIGYTLDDEYKDMFISYNEEGLLIIQVGLGDEGPKFIAYK